MTETKPFNDHEQILNCLIKQTLKQQLQFSKTLKADIIITEGNEFMYIKL